MEEHKVFVKRSEALELLGVDRRAFTNMVEAGIIRKYIPPGRKYGYYRTRDIVKILKREK